MPNENLRKLLRQMEEQRTVDTSDVMHGGNYHQTLNRPVGGAKQMTKEAKLLGEKYAKHILQAEGGTMKGGNFWKDFKKGFDMVIKPAAKVAKAASGAFGQEGKIAKDVIEAVGYGQTTGGESFWDGFKRGFKPAGKILKAVAPLAGPYGMAASVGLNAVGLGKPKQKRKQSAKQVQRNALVRKLMKENGLTLPQASSYIKQNNLL